MSKRKYKVAVMEVYRKVLTVQASNPNEAQQRVNDGWYNGEVLLNENDFNGIEVCILDSDNEEETEKIESKE